MGLFSRRAASCSETASSGGDAAISGAAASRLVLAGRPLALFPESPQGQAFDRKLVQLGGEAVGAADDTLELDRIAERLEAAVKEFGEEQRTELTRSLKTLDIGLRATVGRLEHTLQSGDDFSSEVSATRDRLKDVHQLRSYDELRKVLDTEITRLSGALKRHHESARETREGLQREVEHLRSRLTEAESVSHTDFLTGVLSRRAFEKALSEIKELNKWTLASIDLDGFKPINDTFGHAAGDSVLRDVAKRISEGIGKHATIGRMGGDEFALIVKDSEEHVLTRLRSIEGSLAAEPPRVGERKAKIGMSFGTALIDPAMRDRALTIADERMYLYKRSKRAAA